MISLIQNKYDPQYLPPLVTIQFVWQETAATCSSSSLSSILVISGGHTKHEQHSLVPGLSVQRYCSNMASSVVPYVDISRHSKLMKTKLVYLFLGDYTQIKTYLRILYSIPAKSARCHYILHTVHHYNYRELAHLTLLIP